MDPFVEKVYKIAVTVKLGSLEPWRVDVETSDEEGAKRLAQLLKEHDPEVLLREVVRTTAYKDIAVKRWPRKKSRK